MNNFSLSSSLLILFVSIHLGIAQDLSPRVLHYRIDAEIFPSDHRLVSEVKMLVTNPTTETLRPLEFVLSCDTVYSVQDGGGNSLPFIKRPDNLQITHQLVPGDSMTIVIRYTGIYLGRVSNRIDVTNSWLLTESLWFPMVQDRFKTPSWFTYDLFITVPDDQMAVSSGTLIGVEHQSPRKRFHWKVSNPTPWMSVVSARYARREYQHKNFKITTYLYDDRATKSDSLVSLVSPMLDFYEEQFGKYPFDEFKIVETDRRGGYGPPGMILLNSFFTSLPDDTSRQISATLLLVHEIAHQWWGSSVVTVSSPFLNESLAQHSALLFLEHRGLTETPMLARTFRSDWVGIDLKSDLRLFEAVYFWNQRPYDYTPLAELNVGNRDYVWASYYKGAAALWTLAWYIGEDSMRKGLQLYYDRFRFKATALSDFQAVLEETAGRDLQRFFFDWMFTTRKCDYGLSDLRSQQLPDGTFKTEFVVANHGDIVLPVQVVLTTRSGKQIPVLVKEFSQCCERIELNTTEEVISGIVDPSWKILDVNRTNNVYPRERKVAFLLARPSAYAVTYYFGPSITYGLTDGLRVGAWLTNSTVSPARKQVIHPLEWRLGAYYGIKSNRPGYSISLNSWYGMPSNRWQYGGVVEDVRGTQAARLHIGYRWWEDHGLNLTAERFDVRDLSYYDPQDYQAGMNTFLNLAYQASTANVSIAGDLRVGKRLLGGDYDFVRGSASVNGPSPFSEYVRYRLFAGFARGSFPAQESIFLSGSVLPSSIAYWFLDPDRSISTQEHLRVPGDANLRGYIGQHRRGRNALALNTELSVPSFTMLKLFADAGNVWDTQLSRVFFDAGFGLDLTFLRVDVPFYVSAPMPGEGRFAFRWTIEVKL